MPLPRLSVPTAVAVEVLKGLIQDGEKILSDYVRGPYNPPIVLMHTLTLSSWSRAGEDRVNALFEGPVVPPGGLLTPEGTGLKLGTLRDLLFGIDLPRPTLLPPPQAIPQLTSGTHKAQRQLLPLDIERVGLHPKLLEHCKDHYAEADYDEAILNAFKFVETEVRARAAARPEDIGTSLMSLAFSPSNPRLRISAVSAEQEGCLTLFRGAISLFKNPHSHRFVGIDNQRRAFELLTFASLLLHLLDECKDASTSPTVP
jgi:uncharacterized protein (TIGR02391 family)